MIVLGPILLIIVAIVVMIVVARRVMRRANDDSLFEDDANEPKVTSRLEANFKIVYVLIPVAVLFPVLLIAWVLGLGNLGF